MRSPDDKSFFLHIKESIKKIQEYTNSMDFKDFEKSTLLQDAVIRQLEILGEASKKLSEDFRSSHPSVPWKFIVGMRNRLIHDYFGVDIEAVWETVIKDIPFLKKELAK